VGAGIEMMLTGSSDGGVFVASRVGAGIEICLVLSIELQPPASRPVWARGLKFSGGVGQRPLNRVASRVGAGIEIFSHSTITSSCTSRPVWARGLKYIR